MTLFKKETNVRRNENVKSGCLWLSRETVSVKLTRHFISPDSLHASYQLFKIGEILAEYF
jgi:hypothetical protein